MISREQKIERKNKKYKIKSSSTATRGRGTGFPINPFDFSSLIYVSYSLLSCVILFALLYHVLVCALFIDKLIQEFKLSETII